MGSWLSWDNSFDDHLNWVAMDNVASINAPTPSWLRISIRVSSSSAPWWHLCSGKDPGLGNLLGLNAKYLLQKSVLRLLIPYNLWLHKHFCFCRLGNSTAHELSSAEGEVGEAEV